MRERSRFRDVGFRIFEKAKLRHTGHDGTINLVVQEVLEKTVNRESAKNRSVPPPGDYIRDELKKRSWTQDDLATVLGRTVARVNQIITGKQELSPEIAVELEIALGTPATVWLQREAAYRLSLTQTETADVRQRSRLYEFGPIKEMQKRGWIETTDSVEALEQELLRFFAVPNLDTEPVINTAMRKTMPTDPLTSIQRAWCFRVKQLGRVLKVSAFDESRLGACEKELRKLAAYPQEVRKVPKVLASYGIRFVVVEPLASGKVDGMVTWLDEKSPVIGMSMRFDRIDAFWFTLGHEFSHVRHRDAVSVDSDVIGIESMPLDGKPEFECRADREAAAMLIAPSELDSFILRVGPLYSRDRINQFANRIKMHPGIIVGQLQHKGEMGFGSLREMLVKVRETVTSVALVDGWGHTVDPRIIP